MEPDAWAAIAAWAGFAATAVAGYVAYRQARTAQDALRETRLARKIASDQANSARQSAESASKATDAALWQARNLEKQTRLVERQTYQADRPTLDVTAHLERSDWLRLTVRMVSGPGPVTVSVDCLSTARVPTDSGHRDDFQPQEFDEQTQIVENGEVTMAWSVPAGATDGEVDVTVFCDEVDGDRSWSIRQIVRWERPVEPWVMVE